MSGILQSLLASFGALSGPALYSWGDNYGGYLGLNDSISRSSPTQVGDDLNWLKVSEHNDPQARTGFAIKSNNSLWAWGSNNRGTLGLSLPQAQSTSSPVQVGALTNWAQVSRGVDHVAAVTTSNQLYVWGDNARGELGLNFPTSLARSSPNQVGTLTNWAQVSAGGNRTFAVKTDGTLWSWGSNSYGTLGQTLAPAIDRSSPVQIGALTGWGQVATGQRHTIARRTDGTLFSWGRNLDGALGLNTRTTDYVNADRSSPVQVGTLTNWSFVATGSDTCFVVKTDGTLWSWGNGDFGKLGQNTAFVSRSSPVQIGALTGWTKVVAAFAHTAARRSDGSLFVWGDNGSGALGQDDRLRKSSPTQVGALTGWIDVACLAGSTIAILKE